MRHVKELIVNTYSYTVCLEDYFLLLRQCFVTLPYITLRSSENTFLFFE